MHSTFSISSLLIPRLCYMFKAAWLLQQLVPPLALTYFSLGWRVCCFELGPGYVSSISGKPWLGRAYSVFATLSISCLTALYFRLYFLSSTQSAPPRLSDDIRDKRVIYECLSPSETAAVLLKLGSERDGVAESRAVSSTETDWLQASEGPRGRKEIGLVNTCHRDRCKGRWKPARARHCSLCRTCRCGFDHHCAIFANCLTAPYIPHFLCLLSLAPTTILLLISPLAIPLARRAVDAWTVACENEAIQSRWWDWKASWIIAGGPMGRWVGGLILGWKILDRQDGGGVMRLQIGILAFLGLVISLVCVALIISTVSVFRNGHLTVDRERNRSHNRARRAILDLQRAGKSIPQQLVDSMERLADRRWFFVPVPDHPDGGVVLPTLPEERAYDHGPARNWAIIMGSDSSWGWLLPWRAVRMGMNMEQMANWPLNPEVEKRLRTEAERVAATRQED